MTETLISGSSAASAAASAGGDHEFTRALRLLHSRAKDSADLLKAMLDDVLKSRANTATAGGSAAAASKHETKSKQSLQPMKGIETAVIKSSADYKRDHLFDGNSRRHDIQRAEKSFEYPLEKKRMRLDSPQRQTSSRSTTSSPQPSGAGIHPQPKVLLPTSSSSSSSIGSSSCLTTTDEDMRSSVITSTSTSSSSASSSSLSAAVPIKVEDDSEATDIEDENQDAGEFAMEMGLACVTCKQIDIAPNNQLVECQECHNLYHQECHKPPLMDRDISDPRFVWYCAKCQKSMMKKSAAAASSAKPTKTMGGKTSTSSTTSITSSLLSSSPVISQSREHHLTSSSLLSSSSTTVSGLKTPVKVETNADTYVSSSTAATRLIQPFKREPKTQLSTGGGSGNGGNGSSKPIGLAALANISRAVTGGSATFKTNKNNGGNNGSSAVSSSTATGGSSLMSSGLEKRLQSLKKNKSKK
ncbi:integrator complex subunit 12-like isoform X2 [Oppia nitens]|uniref:integrator complex subunit 12-like isoform X2 n=1 Tax=Oppia nitens TaxID=1686743 RepID=UPI0023DA7C21|nr:integrator complex subunit 12-like isoform X2 [Oppia nitens]